MGARRGKVAVTLPRSVDEVGDGAHPLRNRLLGSVQGCALVNEVCIRQYVIIGVLSDGVCPAVANPLGFGASFSKIGFKRAMRRKPIDDQCIEVGPVIKNAYPNVSPNVTMWMAGRYAVLHSIGI